MGVSNRVPHAIEPAAGDLLMPERIRRPRNARSRDVEDASFETLGNPHDLFAGRDAQPHGVFKSQIVPPPAEGPVPRAYSPSDQAVWPVSETSGRLGVFGSRGGSAAHMYGFAIAVPMVVMMLGAMAVVELLIGSEMPAPRSASIPQSPAAIVVSSDVADVGTDIAADPDPVVTSSIPETDAQSDGPGYATPAPRPARIERAGSILMIRPSGG